METIIITLDNNKKKEYVKGIKLKEIIEQEKDKLTKSIIILLIIIVALSIFEVIYLGNSQQTILNMIKK